MTDDAAKDIQYERDERADRETVEQLRRRLTDLADQQQGILLEMDEIQSELAELDPEGEEVPVTGEDSETALRRELAESRSQYQRALADFQNFQRRAAENERRARESGRAGVLEALVGVMDNFDLALRMNPDEASAASILQGVELIRGEMLRVLAQQGFRIIEPAPADELDPTEHEALTAVPHDDIPPGSIVELHQVGYALGGRVIRPAKVSISAEAPAGDAPESKD